MRYFLIFISITACASISMLPKTADQISFSEVNEGKTGWSQYQQYIRLKGVGIEKGYEAAKSALGESGFALKELNRSARRVVGEHGVTWHDWNVIAGIYFKQNQDDLEAIVIVEGSKDFGVSGDVTGDGWSGKILNSMVEYIKKNPN